MIKPYVQYPVQFHVLKIICGVMEELMLMDARCQTLVFKCQLQLIPVQLPAQLYAHQITLCVQEEPVLMDVLCLKLMPMTFGQDGAVCPAMCPALCDFSIEK